MGPVWERLTRRDDFPYGKCGGGVIRMRSLSGRKGTEFSPRVPIDSQIFPFCPLFRVISYLRRCSGTRIFKFGPIVSHSCFSWRLGGPCLCGCRLTPAGAQCGRHKDRALFIEHMILYYRNPKGLPSGKCHLDVQMRWPTGPSPMALPVAWVWLTRALSPVLSLRAVYFDICGCV